MKKLLLFLAMTGSVYAQQLLPEELAIARSMSFEFDGPLSPKHEKD